MELILGLIGTLTGVVGLVISCVITRNQIIRQAESEAKLARSARLEFLANVIIDTSIPRKARQPFYDEYVAMKGNGTVVKFWLLEGEKAKS